MFKRGSGHVGRDTITYWGNITTVKQNNSDRQWIRSSYTSWEHYWTIFIINVEYIDIIIGRKITTHQWKCKSEFGKVRIVKKNEEKFVTWKKTLCWFQENPLTLSGKFIRVTSATSTTGKSASIPASSAMSSSFDENDEEENDQNVTTNKANDPIFKFNNMNRILYNNNNTNNNNNNSNNILQTFSNKTTNRIFKWMSINWNDRDYDFSSIDARRYLPPIYQSSKNIAKTIRVSQLNKNWTWKKNISIVLQ